LKIMEERRLIEGREKIGRKVTEKGLEKLSRALAYDRMGSILTKYISLAHKTTYSPDNNAGDVVANIAVIDKNYGEKAVKIIRALYEIGLLPSPHYMMLDEGDGVWNTGRDLCSSLLNSFERHGKS